LATLDYEKQYSGFYQKQVALIRANTLYLKIRVDMPCKSR